MWQWPSGTPSSFEAMYREYGDRIYRFCYRLCGHSADAEDLAQEVFLAAYQALPRFAGRSSVATWLYRIALYRWRRLHGARRPETVPLDEGLVAQSPDPARAGLERLSLERALAALPGALREAFLLVKAEGFKYREAAAVLGIPQGTVQSRVHDAAVMLRALLAEAEPSTREGEGSRALGDGGRPSGSEAEVCRLAAAGRRKRIRTAEGP